jgi:mRNA interferase MazF
VKRGEVWTLAGGNDYAGKPRPAVIVQDDRFDKTASITLCGFTTNSADAPIFRIPITPDASNGLLSPSRLMVDKIATVPRSKLRTKIGRLSDVDLVRLNRAIVVFLGITARVSE